MRCKLLFGLLVLAFALYGCSNNRKPITESVGSGDILLSIWASNQCPDSDEVVTLRAIVANQGSKSLLVESKNQPVFDIIVGNPDTSQTRWSSGKPLTSELTRLELKSGQSKTIEMTWRTTDQGGISAILVDRPIRPLSIGLNIGNCPGMFGP